MIADSIVAELRRVSEEYPQGALVWHRASGARGVVVGWDICGRDVMVLLTYGSDNSGPVLPCEISGTKPVDLDDEGESWKAAG